MARLTRSLVFAAPVGLALAGLLWLFLGAEPAPPSRRDTLPPPAAPARAGKSVALTPLHPERKKQAATRHAGGPRFSSPDVSDTSSASASAPLAKGAGSGAQAASVGSDAPVALVTTESKTFTVKGRVLDERGLPVAGARVTLSVIRIPFADEVEKARSLTPEAARVLLPKRDLERRFEAQDELLHGKGVRELAVARSERDGTFSLGPVTTPVYETSTGDPLVRLSAISEEGEGRPLVGARQIATVGSGWGEEPYAFDDQDVTVKRLARVLVRVRAGGASLAGASVLVRYNCDPDGDLILLEKPTDEAGSSEERIDGAFGWITVAKAGFATEHRTVKVERGDDPSPQAPLAPLPPIEVVVDLAPEAKIAGRVVDAAGQPVEGARVSAKDLSAKLPEGEGYFEYFSDTATTDAEGRFALGSLSAGRTYDVAVSRDDDSLLDASREVVAPAHDVTIALGRAGSVLVALRLPRDYPEPGTEADPSLTLQRRNDASGAWESVGSGTGEAGENGQRSYAFAKQRPGTFRVVANGWQKLAAAETPPFSVAAGDELSRVALELALGRSVTGRVVDASGSPVASAHVEWIGYEVDPNDHGSDSPEQGTFALDGLPLGEAQLRVTADGFVTATVKVPVGATTLPDIVLAREAPGGG